MTDTLRQRGFIYHTLFTKWPEIIGDDFSAFSRPVRMRFSRCNDGAILTLRINSALGPEMQLQAENIRERINQFYGRGAVKKIKFDTSCDPELLRNGKKRRNEKKDKKNNLAKGTAVIDFDKAKTFKISTSDTELKSMLETLQINWFYRRRKCNKNG